MSRKGERERMREFFMDMDDPRIDLMVGENFTALMCRNAAYQLHNAMIAKAAIAENLADENMLPSIHLQLKQQTEQVIEQCEILFEATLDAVMTDKLIHERCNCQECKNDRALNKLVAQMFNARLS